MNDLMKWTDVIQSMAKRYQRRLVICDQCNREIWASNIYTVIERHPYHYIMCSVQCATKWDREEKEQEQ